MNNNKETASGRRKFLKGSLAVGAAGLVAGISATQKAEAAAVAPQTSCKEYWFDTPPAPIPASAIKTTKTVDVVVLGAGISGLCAAYAAAEKGAKVVVLEKRKTYTSHGMGPGCIDSRLHKKQNIVIPKDQVMADIMRFGAFHPNPRLIKLWMDESGRIMDRLLDMADANQLPYALYNDVHSYWPYTEFPLGVTFLPHSKLLGTLEAECQKRGVEFLYKTPAVQLIRKDKKGRVSGVIGKAADGSYLQVNGSKGIIVCTGGYGSNKEMQEKFSPRILKTVNNQYFEGSNTGDGILMGMWIGGAKQETDCPMLWDGMIPGHALFVSIARQPWLYVNQLGERYSNEDSPFGYQANADIQQPGSMRWAVWDARWDEEKEKFHSPACRNMHIPFFWNETSYESYKKKGVIIEADTLEALAAKMEVPVATFLASVKRYNELVQKGVDEDFGKNPAKLTSLVKAPYGACKVGTGILDTMDGLRINTDLNVLDTESNPIPGLYAAGLASGDFFSNDYPITSGGSSMGRCYTFGWLAGEKTAAL